MEIASVIVAVLAVTLIIAMMVSGLGFDSTFLHIYFVIGAVVLVWGYAFIVSCFNLGG